MSALVTTAARLAALPSRTWVSTNSTKSSGNRRAICLLHSVVGYLLASQESLLTEAIMAAFDLE